MTRPDRRRHPLVLFIAALAFLPALTRANAEDREIVVVDGAPIHWKEGHPEVPEDNGFYARFEGQSVVRTVDLPAGPERADGAWRIMARVFAQPIIAPGEQRPNDPWPRLGYVTVVEGDRETEVMRFVTGFGGAATFTQDVTALAPLLTGTRTLRLVITSYGDRPGWTASLILHYLDTSEGVRRPAFARSVIHDLHVTRARPSRRGTVTIPEGLDTPRLRILSTGHASDGAARNEFISCPHILRVDGVEVARFRPWSEAGATVRRANPWAGRQRIGDRIYRSSDHDRSGWHPGLPVEPLLIPAPELTPGRHEIEIQIDGIRELGPVGDDGKRHHGYWVVSVVVVGDEAWPEP